MVKFSGILIILFITNIHFGYAQITLHRSQSILTSKTKVGYNLNSLTKPSWTNSSFNTQAKGLGIPILRYPGGTISQYWDWQNGKALPKESWGFNGLKNYSFLGTTSMVPHTLEELKRG